MRTDYNTERLKCGVNSLSEKDLIGIARSKSIETLLRLAIGKREQRRKRDRGKKVEGALGKRQAGREQAKDRKREPCPLLDGTIYLRVSHPG